MVLQEARAGSPPLAAELQAFVKERLAPYKYPREVVFVETLPRTHLGKVDRGRLRRSTEPDFKGDLEAGLQPLLSRPSRSRSSSTSWLSW